MKNIYLFILLPMMLATTSCEDKYTEIFVANSPIYTSYEDMRQAVKQIEPTDLLNPGKIYFKDDYIFIVESMKGIHLFDNTNPAQPVNLSYVEVPGIADMAIKGDILYVDSYVDMVALDLSDLSNIHEVSRVEDVLPYTIPPYDEKYPVAQIDEEKGVVSDWEIKKVKQVINNYYYPVYVRGGFDKAVNDAGGMSGGGVSSQGVGVGGSMARFGIYENTLYAVDNTDLHIFSITDPSNPTLKKEFNAGWAIETLFILNDKMFLGAQNGMRLYDISVPNSPMFLSNFWHLTGCDPVVVQDDIAYVTLRGGNNCGNNVNQLVVVSIADITEPRELKAYPMEGPYGLGIDGNTLFVCDGDAGLKVYDVTDPLRISEHQIARFTDIFGFDAIPINGVLMLIGEDGLYQYDYSNPRNILLLSKIEVQ